MATSFLDTLADLCKRYIDSTSFVDATIPENEDKQLDDINKIIWGVVLSSSSTIAAGHALKSFYSSQGVKSLVLRLCGTESIGPYALSDNNHPEVSQTRDITLTDVPAGEFDIGLLFPTIPFHRVMVVSFSLVNSSDLLKFKGYYISSKDSDTFLSLYNQTSEQINNSVSAEGIVTWRDPNTLGSA